MKTKKIDWRVLATALVVLGVVECFALSQGIDGTMFAIVVGLIGLIAGVAIPTTTK